MVPISTLRQGPHCCTPRLPSRQCLSASLNASATSSTSPGFLVVPDPLHVLGATLSVGLSSIFLLPSILEPEREDRCSRGSPGTARVATCRATRVWTLQEEVICGKWAGQDEVGQSHLNIFIRDFHKI